VVVAGNGRETLAAFESGDFDLILMDLQMPEMDGFEATTRFGSGKGKRESRANRGANGARP